MLGAIIGDIVGSVYEWNNIKTKDFPLFREDCFFTDDTVMTCAVAEAIMNGGQKDDFIDTILEIHESIMGNKECSFSLQTVDKARKKTPVELTLRIYDDGSHSVDRTKVFIYDMALLFNQYTRDRHPLFLVHDNIFDVDQDTLVQCLNYIYKQEEQYQDFQYILTLNRDKIENEEQRKLIQMDIDEHQVAVFTKEKKFLGRNYQEK